MADLMMCVCHKCGNIKGDNGRPNCSRCGAEKIKTDTTLDEHLDMTAVQEQQWREEIKEKYVKSNPEFDEEAMNKRLTAEFKERQAEQNKPKCPTCGSTNIKKISGLERGASVMTLGLLSRKINKTFKCGNCGYTW